MKTYRTLMLVSIWLYVGGTVHAHGEEVIMNDCMERAFKSDNNTDTGWGGNIIGNDWFLGDWAYLHRYIISNCCRNAKELGHAKTGHLHQKGTSEDNSNTQKKYSGRDRGDANWHLRCAKVRNWDDQGVSEAWIEHSDKGKKACHVMGCPKAGGNCEKWENSCGL